MELGTTVAFAVACKAEAGKDLLGQQVEQAFDIDTDMVSHRTAVDRRISEISGEDDGSRQFDDVAQHFCRRQRVAVRMLVKQSFL